MVSRDNSLLSTVTLFALSFASFEVDYSWLDEITEGLKHVMIAIDKIVVNLLNQVRADGSQIFAEGELVKQL